MTPKHQSWPEHISLPHWGRDKMAAIFQMTFSNAFSWMKIYILIKISLTFVPQGPINNIPALVQIMTLRHPGKKLLSEPMMVSLLTHICLTLPQWVKTALNFTLSYFEYKMKFLLITPTKFHCNYKMILSRGSNYFPVAPFTNTDELNSSMDR